VVRRGLFLCPRLVFPPEQPNQNGISVSSAGRSILYTQVGEENSDIMLVDHFH